MKKITFAKPIDKRKAVEIAHIIYAVLLIALAITVGILFIVNVVDVYNSSDFSPFTVEAISSHFRAIAVPVIMLPCFVVFYFDSFAFKREYKMQNKTYYNKAG